MRHQTQTFLEEFLNEKGPFKKALEVGALDVSGSIKGILERFTTKYVGTDMREGEGVGVVVNAHALSSKFKKNSFDLVVCFDTLEHDDAFWKSVSEMRKVLKTGGYLVIGAPGRACPLHSHPDDFWRFMPSSFDLFFKDFEDYTVKVEYQDESYLNQQIEAEIYAYGRKV